MERHSKVHPKLSVSEYQRFAERFVDLIVDPKRPWLVRYIVAGGLKHIPTDEELDSGDFALRVLNQIDHLEREGTWLIEASLYEALNTGDREFLVPYTKRWAQEAAFSYESLRLLLKMGESSSLKQSFKRLSAKFAFRSGGSTKITRHQFDKILSRAEQLRPAIEKILKELSSHTSHTLEEILEYCRKDYPQACDFLSLHIQRFQQAFNDRRVVNRATKRISARAGALADAMAGTDYGLAFSTSIEKVREARRSAWPEEPSSDSP
jgi:hypothetical protein